VDLPLSFSDFLRQRQPRFRTKLRTLLKRLDENALAFEAHCDARELRRRLRSLFSLHQMRWHHAGVPGVFGDPAKRAFYAHFVTRFARNGWLRLYSLREGDDYLAHQLCFGLGGVTYLLQEGFDVSNAAASYGQMLRAAVIRHLIENGERQYDFLGGFSKHKEDWGGKEGKTVHLVIARRSWRGQFYFTIPVWRDQLVTRAKQVLPTVLVRYLGRLKSAAGSTLS
jgi:CelD/BcsL family acetyltransferase involved in cellulose biosynthesis